MFPEHMEFWAGKFKHRVGKDLCFLPPLAWPFRGWSIYSWWDLETTGSGSGPRPRWSSGCGGTCYVHRVQKGAWDPAVMGKEAEQLGGRVKGHLPLPKDGTLNGRKNSRCSLELIWQRVVGIFSGCSRGNGLWDRSLPFFKNCAAFE